MSQRPVDIAEDEEVTCAQCIELFISDARSQGRINSDATERSYRSILYRHAEDVRNLTPEATTRDDVKRTLRRWANPNTQRVGRAVLVSFYDWLLEEGYRIDNPARQTRRPRRQPTPVYRLTVEEVNAILAAASGVRERRAIFLGICVGLRNQELRGLQGRHFERPDFVWVSTDIAKGGRERWVPVLDDLKPVVEEIRANVGPDEFVLPAQRWRDPGSNQDRGDLKTRASSSQALRTLVMGVAKRAGIKAHIYPHLMRHAYGDYIARTAGLKVAQHLLGHAGVGTTETYIGKPTLGELAIAVRGLSFGDNLAASMRESAAIPVEATTGFEPVSSRLRVAIEDFPFDSAELREKVEVYLNAFGELEVVS